MIHQLHALSYISFFWVYLDQYMEEVFLSVWYPRRQSKNIQLVPGEFLDNMSLCIFPPNNMERSTSKSDFQNRNHVGIEEPMAYGQGILSKLKNLQVQVLLCRSTVATSPWPVTMNLYLAIWWANNLFPALRYSDMSLSIEGTNLFAACTSSICLWWNNNTNLLFI